MFRKLFSKLRGQDEEPVDEGEWVVAEAEDDGNPIILRIRQVPPEFDRSAYPHMISVVWPYEVAGEGMPGADEKEGMDALEDLLMPALERSSNAILTVAITGNGMREWQWYSRSMETTMDIVNATLAPYDPFPVEFSLTDDPDWEGYSHFDIA